MAFTTPGTAVAGEVLTAAFWNEQVRDNTAYLKDEADAVGLVKITPTAAVVTAGSASIEANGSVTFTGCTTLQLEGIFSAAYRNYQFVISATATGGDRSLQGRVVSGSTPVTGSAYNFQQFTARATTFAGVRQTAQAQWGMGRIDMTGKTVNVITICDPFEALSTVFTSHGSDSNGTISLSQHAGIHTTAASYDGFLLTPNLNNMTGLVAVYGMNA